MTTIKMLLLGLILSGSISFLSCKKDNDPSGCDYITETQDELNALTEASTAWSADPTNPTLCQAYKDAWQAYVDELENHKECAALAGQQAELQAIIDQYQASLDAFQC